MCDLSEEIEIELREERKQEDRMEAADIADADDGDPMNDRADSHD